MSDWASTVGVAIVGIADLTAPGRSIIWSSAAVAGWGLHSACHGANHPITLVVGLALTSFLCPLLQTFHSD
jgi:hypothetical protein